LVYPTCPPSKKHEMYDAADIDPEDD